MTQQRRDEHSTEFGIWLRQQPEIDSKIGYIATNLDYIWHNYNTGEFMLIEEKRHGAFVKFPQSALLKMIDDCMTDSQKYKAKYKGLHILVFTNTNPDDGKTILDGKIINREELIIFLTFKAKPDAYKTTFYQE